MSNSAPRGLVENMVYIDDSPFLQHSDQTLKDILNHTSFQTSTLMEPFESNANQNNPQTQ